MRHSITISLAVVVAAALLWVLPLLAFSTTAEQPVSQPSLVRAPYAQTSPSAASNGSDFVVTWIDERGSDGRPYLSQTVYATHVDGNGIVSPSMNARIAAGYSAAVASTGNGYVVVYQGVEGTWTQQLAGDGTPAGQRRLLLPAPRNSSIGVLSLVSNGRSYLLVVGQTSPQAIRVFLLDADGALEKELAITAANQLDGTAVVMNDKYHVVHSSWTCPGVVPCTATILDEVIDEVAGSATPRLIHTDLGQSYRLAAAATANRLLVSWVANRTIDNHAQEVIGYAMTDRTGALIATVPNAAETPTACFCPYSDLRAGWDGAKFLIAFRTSDPIGPPALEGIRVGAEGDQIDAKPVAISDSIQTLPAFALSRTAQLLVWPTVASGSDWSQTDLIGRIGSSFDAILSRPDGFVIAQSSSSQQQADIAALGDGAITVWRDLGNGSSIEASISTAAGAQPIVVAPPVDGAQDSPAVATTSDTALVVWWRYAADLTRARLLGRRIRRDGSFIDAAPIVVASDAPAAFWNPGGHIGVATDGKDFLVAWPASDYELHVARVRSEGTLAVEANLTISRPLDRFNGVPYEPHVIWTGTVYLVAWFADPNLPGFATPWIAAVNIRAARVSREGVLLDDVQNLDVFSARGWTGGMALARTSDRVVIAWSYGPAQPSTDHPCILTLASALDGTLNHGAPTQAYCGTDIPSHVAGAGTADQVMVIGTSGNSIIAVDLDADGHPHGTHAFTISPAGAYQPAIAALGTRFAIAYTRTADDASYGGVGRLFTVLTNGVERHRTTGH